MTASRQSKKRNTTQHGQFMIVLLFSVVVSLLVLVLLIVMFFNTFLMKTMVSEPSKNRRHFFISFCTPNGVSDLKKLMETMVSELNN